MTKTLSFKNALIRAGKVLRDKNLSLKLIEQARTNLSSKERLGEKYKSAKKMLADFVRLLKNYVIGEYKNVSWNTIILVTAVLIYFVTPIDIIPDFLPITGLIDDASLAIWLYQQINEEMQKFLIWEASNKKEKTK